MRDNLVRARMGIQRACMRGETRCMRACRDLACAYAHGGLAWAWGFSMHGQRISAVHACAWRPGACTHGDPACVCGDLVCARMGILRACVRVWGPGACTHGHPACVRACVRGDPVRVRMGILRVCVGTRCVHAWESCVRAFVRGDPVRARMVILRACVRVGTQCMHAWGSCVRGPGPCMRGDALSPRYTRARD